MTNIFFGESFALKDVSQVTATIHAQDFYSMAVGVGFPFHRSFDFIIKTWPATIRFEFMRGIIKRFDCIAGRYKVRPQRFSCIRRFPDTPLPFE